MRWREYVPVHKRRSNGLAQAQRALGKGKTLQPIHVEGRKIAKTFWGTSWCEHFETYSDYANRLPRGRTYCRNGSIVHLEVLSGKIVAMVAGSDLYNIKIEIDTMPAKVWKRLCKQCASSVTGTIDLLRGKLPEPIFKTLTNPDNDLFPRNKEIRLSCDCPDWAGLCKHLAAVLYGIGNRLDDSPELLFVLRGVDQDDLIGSSLVEATDSGANADDSHQLESSELEDIFGIAMVDDSQPVKPFKSKRPRKAKTAVAKKKTARKKTAKKAVARSEAVKKKVKSKQAAAKKPSAKKPVGKTTIRKKKANKKKPTAGNSIVTKVIQDLVTAVDNTKQNAKFCTSGIVDLPQKSDGNISIDGLGAVSLPLRPKGVREIIAFAETAPYGKGTRTIIDQSVRNSLEIKARKLTVSDELDQAVEEATQQAAIELGLPADRLQAKLYKLLVYQEGGFFLPHRDSEKRKSMVGSMVVMLPSKFSGGELLVQHQDAKKRFAFSKAAAGNECEFTAFYADCLHEVRSVKTGVRVCLSYNLCLKPERKQRAAEPNAPLVSAIGRWTITRPTDPMVFALEHQYTAAGLKPGLLKGNDRASAEQLIAAADEANCHLHFGQVSRHLMQAAEDGSYGRGRCSDWSNFELADLDLGEAYEDDVLIDGWKDAAGTRLKLDAMHLESSTLISTTPLEEWKPTSYDYEGYTGNAGNTLDRWFHKSAVVIWSKASHYDVLVKMGHRSSIEAFLKQRERIAELKNKTKLQQARADSDAFARAIIRAWPQRFSRYHEAQKDDSPWFKHFADALPTFEDSELIGEFLQTLATQDWQVNLSPLLRESFKRLGPETMFDILKRFVSTRPTANQYGHSPGTGLPIRDGDWMLKIACHRKQSGLSPSQFSELNGLMLQRLRVAVTGEQQRRWRSNNFAPTFILLMKSAIAASDDAAMNNCLRLRSDAGNLFDKREFDAKACADLVKWSDKRGGDRLESLSEWLKEIRDFLESETAYEPERPSNFVRPNTIDCACPQCAELHAFLGNAKRETGEIRALKTQLEHVRDQIRQDKLDATTILDRSTRPFTLNLKKTQGSYQRDLKRFQQDLKRLASLP